MTFPMKFLLVLLSCAAAGYVLSVVAPAQSQTGGLIISVIGSLVIIGMMWRKS